MRKFILSASTILFVLVNFNQALEEQDSCDEAELIFASILYRHGERTPEKPYPNDPYKNISFWPPGWGMLTNTGKKQQYELGQWLRKRYIPLIPDGEYNHNVVYVQSTDYDRTLMSAQCNNAGLFYPTEAEMWSDIKWQPVPVHTTPKELDKVLSMEHPCQRYKEEKEFLINSTKVQAYYQEHQQLFDYVSEQVGEPSDDPEKIQRLYSTLYIQTLNNYTLPDWTKSVFPDKLYEVGAYGFKMNTMTKTQKRLYGGPLLKEIILHMKNKRDGILIPNRNLWVYSAHDTTVAALLDTMGVFEVHMPPFTATVLVELRENYGEYYVSVLYKNSTEEPQLLTIPGCTPSCPLDTFESLLSDVIPDDWDAECKTTRKHRTRHPTSTTADWLT